MRRFFAVALLASASAVFAFHAADAQLTPPPTTPPATTTPPTPSPTCIGLGCIVTPRPTVRPTPTETPEPTIVRTQAPRVTPSPTASATSEPEETTSPTPRPTLTPSPTPLPSPASPNRGLAVLGLFGSGGMLGSAAWIWRRYLS